MQRSVEQSIDNRQRAAQADASLQRIADAVDQINDMNQQIAHATKEQATTMEEIRRQYHRYQHSADKASDEMRAVDEAGSSLDELAQRVGAMVTQFRI